MSRIIALTLICCESSCILVLEDKSRIAFFIPFCGDPGPLPFVMSW
nr:MAG TPA: hypothetical protein [Caudoviricetes sp.]